MQSARGGCSSAALADLQAFEGQAVLRRVEWVGVLLGGAATVLVVLLLEVFVVSPISSYLYGVFAVERPGGATSFTGRAWNTYVALSTSLVLVALPLAFFAGGLVVGRLVSSFPGLNGVAGAAGVVAAGFAWLLATALPGILDPINNPGDVYTRSENLQMFLIWGTAFCAVSPFVVLAGFLGGRLGGQLKNRLVGRGPRR